MDSASGEDRKSVMDSAGEDRKAVKKSRAEKTGEDKKVVKKPRLSASENSGEVSQVQRKAVAKALRTEEKQTRRQKLQKKKRRIQLKVLGSLKELLFTMKKKSNYERRLAPWRRLRGHAPVNTVVTVAYGKCMHPVVHNIWHDLGDSD